MPQSQDPAFADSTLSAPVWNAPYAVGGSPATRFDAVSWTAPLLCQYKPEAQASERLAAGFTRLRFGLVFSGFQPECGAVQLVVCDSQTGFTS